MNNRTRFLWFLHLNCETDSNNNNKNEIIVHIFFRNELRSFCYGCVYTESHSFFCVTIKRHNNFLQNKFIKCLSCGGSKWRESGWYSTECRTYLLTASRLYFFWRTKKNLKNFKLRLQTELYIHTHNIMKIE